MLPRAWSTGRLSRLLGSDGVAVGAAPPRRRGHRAADRAHNGEPFGIAANRQAWGATAACRGALRLSALATSAALLLLLAVAALVSLGAQLVAVSGSRYYSVGAFRAIHHAAGTSAVRCSGDVCATSEYAQTWARVRTTVERCTWAGGGVSDATALSAYWELNDELCWGYHVRDAWKAYEMQRVTSLPRVRGMASCGDEWLWLAAWKLASGTCTAEPAELIRAGIALCEEEASELPWYSPWVWAWPLRASRFSRLAKMYALRDVLSRHGSEEVHLAMTAIADSRPGCMAAVRSSRELHPACMTCAGAVGNLTLHGAALCRHEHALPLRRMWGDGSYHASEEAYTTPDRISTSDPVHFVSAQSYVSGGIGPSVVGLGNGSNHRSSSTASLVAASDGSINPPATVRGSSDAPPLRIGWDVPISDVLAPDVQAALEAPAVAAGIEVPTNVHFVYGLAFGGPPTFGLIEYVAMRSALEVNGPGTTIFFHCARVPLDSYWWQRALEFVRVVRLPRMPIECGDARRCLTHHAHRADYVRLLALQRYGGVYLDMDVLSVRPFPLSVRTSEFVMGWQDSKKYHISRRDREFYGLCNAAMLAKPDARFLRLWLRSYDYMRSSGRDFAWDEHSVLLPANLTERYPDLVTTGAIRVLPSFRMFYPLWNHVERLLFKERRPPNATLGTLDNLPHAYTVHLWRSTDNSEYGRMLQRLPHDDGWWSSSYFGALAARYLQRALVLDDGEGGTATLEEGSGANMLHCADKATMPQGALERNSTVDTGGENNARAQALRTSGDTPCVVSLYAARPLPPAHADHIRRVQQAPPG